MQNYFLHSQIKNIFAYFGQSFLIVEKYSQKKKTNPETHSPIAKLILKYFLRSQIAKFAK